MAEHRPIEEIAAELFSHPEFVIGNFLTRDHVTRAGLDPDRVDPKVADYAADGLSEEMMEYVQNNYDHPEDES